MTGYILDLIKFRNKVPAQQATLDLNSEPHWPPAYKDEYKAPRSILGRFIEQQYEELKEKQELSIHLEKEITRLTEEKRQNDLVMSLISAQLVNVHDDPQLTMDEQDMSNILALEKFE